MRRLANIALAVVWAAGAPALADGVNGLAELEYDRTSSELTGGPSAVARLDSARFAHRYRLTVSKEISTALHFSLAGGVEQQLAWLWGASRGRSDVRNANFSGTVGLTLPLIDAAASYGWREETGNVLLGPGSGFIREGPNAYFAWKPIELPAVTFQIARPSTYDLRHRLDDRTSLDLLLSAAWVPLKQLSLQYSIGYSNPLDRIHQTETRTVGQRGRASYSDAFFAGRVAASATATVDHSLFQAVRAGPTGTAETQRTPMAGFSLVERFPATPVLDTLTPNAPLVDGSLEASAAVNLGTRPSLGGDVDPRDLGAQFADPSTQVNLLYLWVDRVLSAQVAQSFRFSVYQSDDNQHWTEVPLAGPVVFALFQTRFEIPVATTGARYLKVVTRPMDAAVSLDTRYSDVWVTELQFFFVEQVTKPGPWTSAATATLNASVRTVITPELAHDVTLSANAATQAKAVTAYAFANGLTYAKQFNPVFRLYARVAEQEAGDLRGHQSTLTYSAALAADPLPALSQSLTYSGQIGFTRAGLGTTNSVAFFNRGTLYEGIGVSGGASYSVATQANGQISLSEFLTAGASVRPHRKLSFGTSYSHTGTTARGGGRPRTASRVNRLEASATFTPFNALFLSAAGSWSLGRGGGLPQGNFSLSFSPFPGGDLQLGFSWIEMLEATGGRTRLVSPSVRWNLRRGATLTVSYSLLDSRTANEEVHTRVFGAKLQVAL